jgi:hypothetical protein
LFLSGIITILKYFDVEVDEILSKIANEQLYTKNMLICVKENNIYQ